MRNTFQLAANATVAIVKKCRELCGVDSESVRWQLAEALQNQEAARPRFQG
jgi:hypothetical protein